MKYYIGVGIFGGIGALIRVLIKRSDITNFDSILNHYIVNNFPYKTLLANLIGCIIFGFIQTSKNERFKPILTVGLCGGITTFSTFVKDIVILYTSTEYMAMLIYILLTLVTSILFMKIVFHIRFLERVKD